MKIRDDVQVSLQWVHLLLLHDISNFILGMLTLVLQYLALSLISAHTQ
jgi:hypothetical protein